MKKLYPLVVLALGVTTSFHRIAALDAETGNQLYTIPQSAKDFGADTWGNGSWKAAGHTNAWAPMALDEARGLLYAATSTPSGDYWGGWRPGANLFAESIVCLDAATGTRQWHFQAVHHGLWDYDFGSPPNLVTINVDGRTIDAVAQVSKQGFVYVFDRVTGRPVWTIEERPVDTTTDVPGEQPFPTQPVPTKPIHLFPAGDAAAVMKSAITPTRLEHTCVDVALSSQLSATQIG
jgi:quinoprotein glucose dehydrogenase